MSNLKSFYRWIPSLYLMEGLPFALVTAVPPVLYKNFNHTNTKIAFYTSLFALPWAFKPFLAPVLENIVAKRTVILLMQLLIAITLLLLAACLQLANFFYMSAIIFFMMAVWSTIHDMNADGLYIVNLDVHAQAHFIGIRSVCFQLGKLIGQGGLIALAGFFIVAFNRVAGWQIVFVLTALIVLGIMVFHYFLMPAEKQTMDAAKPNLISVTNSFKNVFKEIRKLPHVTAIIIFILLYNLPEAQLLKIVPLFLLDNPSHRGLGLSIADVGVIFGIVGTVSMLIGIMISSFILTRVSLQKCLIPMTIIYSFTNLSYWYLSTFPTHDLWLIGVLIALAQLGYGLVNGVYLFYLMKTFTKGVYPMSMYAIATGLMVLGITLSGAISGYLQFILGYQYFFVWIVLVSFSLVILAAYNSKFVLGSL